MTPAGYRYVLTCELDGDELVPTYPYTIPAYRGKPELLNYPERMRQPNGVKDFIKQNEEGKVTKDACALM